MTVRLPKTPALASELLRAGQAPALSVIAPTRNEADNIRPLLAGLERALAGIDAEVLIVDDSDDDTPAIARQAAASSALQIRVHSRPPGQRTGRLGGAVLAGLSEALAPVCVVMDADLQHPPELLGTLLHASRTGTDFVVASRYLVGGTAEGLDGWYRRAVSRLATRLAKQVLRPELAGISDPLSGFFLVRRSCLDLPTLHSQGFKLLLELLVHSPQASVTEVPYTFGARRAGTSKAGLSEGLTYLSRLSKLGAQARHTPRTSRRQQVLASGCEGADGPNLHQAAPRYDMSGFAQEKQTLGHAAGPDYHSNHFDSTQRPSNTTPEASADWAMTPSALLHRLKCAARLALLKAGRRVTPRHLADLRSVLSYLELGYWLRREHPADRLEVVDDEFALFEIARRRIVGRAPLYLEFGVFEGRSMRWWSRNLPQPGATLVGFDSFKGLPEDWRPEVASGHFQTGKPPQIDDGRVSFQIGWFDETLPRFAVPDHDQIVINVDSDLYSSASTVLRWAEPYLRPGTLIYFDEFWDRDHEMRAFNELRASSSRQFKPLAIAHGGEHWLFEVC